MGERCVVGSGELDLDAYRLSVDLAPGRTGPIVLDLRSLPTPLPAATRAAEAWDDAAVELS